MNKKQMRELIAKQHVALCAVAEYFDNTTDERNNAANNVGDAIDEVQEARQASPKLCEVISDAENADWNNR